MYALRADDVCLLLIQLCIRVLVIWNITLLMDVITNAAIGRINRFVLLVYQFSAIFTRGFANTSTLVDGFGNAVTIWRTDLFLTKSEQGIPYRAAAHQVNHVRIVLL